MSEGRLEASLIDLLGDSALPDFAAEEIGERLLDGALEEGLLKEVPIVKIFLALWRGGKQARDYLFIRKLSKFLKPIAAIPKCDRDEFVRRLNADPEHRTKVGEHLLLLIEQLDDMGKPELVSRAFRAYIEQRIDFDKFKSLANVINRCQLSDLSEIKSHDSPGRYPPAAGSRLLGCGVLEIGYVSPGTPNQYSLTDIGQLLLDVVLRN